MLQWRKPRSTNCSFAGISHRQLTCSCATPNKAFLATSVGALQTALSADASAAATPDTAAILAEGSCDAVLRCAAGFQLCGRQLLLWLEMAAGCKPLLAFTAGAVCLQQRSMQGTVAA